MKEKRWTGIKIHNKDNGKAKMNTATWHSGQKKLITDIGKWVRCKYKTTNYFLPQALSDHVQILHKEARSIFGFPRIRMKAEISINTTIFAADNMII